MYQCVVPVARQNVSGTRPTRFYGGSERERDQIITNENRFGKFREQFRKRSSSKGGLIINIDIKYVVKCRRRAVPNRVSVPAVVYTCTTNTEPPRGCNTKHVLIILY